MLPIGREMMRRSKAIDKIYFTPQKRYIRGFDDALRWARVCSFLF
jgi:hypothetical protein